MRPATAPSPDAPPSATGRSEVFSALSTRHFFALLLTFILWVCCAGVGGFGIFDSTPRFGIPEADAAPPPPVVAKLITVNLVVAPDVAPLASPENAAADSAPPPPLPLPAVPPPPASTSLPPVPALLPVAAPEAVAFALPVEGPVQIVPKAQAAYAVPLVTGAAPDAAALPAPAGLVPQRLVFGVGDGHQPAPEYPDIAIRRNQSGTVRVRFNVGADGQVGDAEVVNSSSFPLLDESAVRTIRRRWRFPPRTPRIYEVEIRFELQS